MILYIRKYPEFKLSWILDRIVIPITIGGMFVRFGNFMNSEIVGKVVDKSFPLGVKFLQSGDFPIAKPCSSQERIPHRKPCYDSQNPQFVEIYNQIPYRHPVQLYEAICYFFLFWLLYYLYGKPTRKTTLLYLWSIPDCPLDNTFLYRICQGQPRRYRKYLRHLLHRTVAEYPLYPRWSILTVF